MIRKISKLTASALVMGIVLTGCKGATSAPEEALSATDKYMAAISGAMTEAKASKGQGSPVMWTMSDDDTTVHLFGTVHLLRPETEWLTPALTAALEASNAIMIEADASSPEAMQQMQPIIMQYGQFEDDQTLSGVLDDEQEALVNGALSGMGATVQAFDAMKPWMVSLQIGVFNMINSGYDPASGVEPKLLEIAKAGNKEMLYLETATDQIKILGGAPIDEQVEGLMMTTLTADSGAEMLDVIVDEWADGDVKGIGAIMGNPDIFGSDEMYDALLTQRNRNWIPKIEALLDREGTYVVAVGAAHLAGDDSVIKMLRDNGHKVKGPK